MRGWDDYEFHTLKLTSALTTGLGHVAFRCSSKKGLSNSILRLKSMGCGIGWNDGDMGHGAAYRAHNKDGHIFEIYFDTQKYQAPENLKPALKNQMMKYPARGVSARRLDHLNLLVTEVQETRKFLEYGLGLKVTEQIILNNGTEAGAWLTATNKTYDIAFTKDFTKIPGRFHHITFAVDSKEEILRAADIFLENNIFIETGPHKHAVQQTFFLYVWEPGGNRVEIANAGARLRLSPDCASIKWTEEERKKGQAWGLKTVESFHTLGMPPVEQGVIQYMKIH